jgi:hypothetical protein
MDELDTADSRCAAGLARVGKVEGEDDAGIMMRTRSILTVSRVDLYFLQLLSPVSVFKSLYLSAKGCIVNTKS